MIIGISGKIGSGKDTLADLIQEIDPRFEIKNFADKLKKIAAILTGFEDQYTQEGKNTYLHGWGMTVGELQQRIGTEAIRNNININAWIIALFSDYTESSRWIITDVRFPNEAVAIDDRHGLLVRLDGTRLITKRDVNHISETALDNWNHWHYRFDNSALTIDQLRTYAKSIAGDACLLTRPRSTGC